MKKESKTTPTDSNNGMQDKLANQCTMSRRLDLRLRLMHLRAATVVGWLVGFTFRLHLFDYLIPKSVIVLLAIIWFQATINNNNSL